MSNLGELNRPPVFHLAIPANDLTAAESFYADVLGCRIGRRARTWIDFDFFGYQLSVHEVDPPPRAERLNEVEAKAIPIPHFGLILDWDDWHRAVDHVNYVGACLSGCAACPLRAKTRRAGDVLHRGSGR